MRIERRLGALLSGILLYGSVIALSGELADWPLLRGFYDVLGGRGSLAVAAGEAGVIAGLVLLLSLLWSYLTLQGLRFGRGSVTTWFFGGLGAAWLGWLAYGVVDFALNPVVSQLPVGVLLLSSARPPLWGILNPAALLLGVLLARSLVYRIQPRLPRRRSSGRLQTTG